MNLKFKKVTHKQPHRFRQMAQLAISSRLYVNGWALKPTLEQIIMDADYSFINESEVLVMAFDGEHPIGVCLMFKNSEDSNLAMTFVRDSYRRKGIGTIMIKKGLAQRTSFAYGLGISGSEKFFESFDGVATTYQSDDFDLVY